MNESKPAKVLFIVGIVALFATGALAYLAEVVPWLWKVMAGVASISLAGAFYFGFADINKVLGRKQTQYGINAVVTGMLAFGIAVVLNLIVSRYDVKYDFTKNKTHTFSEQTIKVLSNLKTDVKMRIFTTPDQTAKFDRIVDRYTYHSKHLIKDYLDPDKEPFAKQKYGIKQPGVIVVETENRSSKIDNVFGPEDPKLEEKITNAIISVMKGDKKKIYFIVGHGERSGTDPGPEGFTEIKGEMESSRYKVEDIQLADKQKVPDDAEVIIVAGPKSEWLDHELKMVETYVMNGGKMLFMVEPQSPAVFQNFLAKFGAKWKAGNVVLETDPRRVYPGGNGLTPLVLSYSQTSEITMGMKQTDISVFAVATSIEKDPIAPAELRLDSLFSTSASSVSAEVSKNNVDPRNGRKGPLGLALSATGKVKTAATPAKPQDKTAPAADKPKDKDFRVVIVGDADFAANQLIKKGANLDLFQNIVSWLANEEDLISIRPRPADESKFEITEERFRIIHFASIWLLPPLFMMSGAGVWWSRRRK